MVLVSVLKLITSKFRVLTESGELITPPTLLKFPNSVPTLSPSILDSIPRFNMILSQRLEILISALQIVGVKDNLTVTENGRKSA